MGKITTIIIIMIVCALTPLYTYSTAHTTDDDDDKKLKALVKAIEDFQAAAEEEPLTPAPPPAVRIAGIEIYGNKTTRPEILELFFDFKVGDTLDLETLRSARTELLRTRLYRKVDIFPHTRDDGAHVFVVLEEAVRLQLAYGASYVTRKYGRDDLWYCFDGDVSLSNFRGRLEEITFGGSLWDHKSLELGWLKPFLTTPYYISMAAGIYSYPDEALPEDYIDVSGRLTVGRYLTTNTRLSLSGIPTFRHRTILEHKKLDWHDNISFRERDKFYEAFAAAALTTDRRTEAFDPQDGWLMSTELRTNLPYPGVNKTFFQLKHETRYYLPLLFDDMAALRFALTLRDTDAGAYHRLTYGSKGSVRGYHEEALGWNFVTNSSILLSIKYHKPIWESPPLPMPIFNLIYRDIKETVYRVDGTLIADYARLYKEPHGAITQRGPAQNGIGLGGGIRLMIPDIRQSGCIDLVYGRYETETGIKWKPSLHIYLDLFY